MEKALNSAMIEERMNEIVARKNEIAETVNAKKEEFESSDVEKREELISEVEALTNEADDLDKEVNDLTEQRNKLSEQEERMSLAKTVSPVKVEERKENKMENIEMRSTPEYAHAWVNAVKGDSSELRTLVSTMNSGTVPIPSYLQGRVEANWERLSILNEVSQSQFKGIVAVPYEASTEPAYAHVENTDAPKEEALAIGQVILNPVTLKKWIRVTSEVESLSDELFMDYLVDEIIYQINLKAETYVVEKAAASTLAVTVSEDLGFNAVNDAMASINEAIDPIVIMNRKTFFANFMGLTDLQERPIYQIATDNAGKPQYFINGVRVLFSNGLKAWDNTSVGEAYGLVGDFKAFRMNFPAGRIPEIIYDPYTEAEDDLSKYVGKLLVAGDVVRPNAIAVLKRKTA